MKINGIIKYLKQNNMKQTELEVGKEYWLGEAKKYKGVYKGSFGKSNYFDVLSYSSLFTRDANGYVEFPLRGVFEIEKWQFTTPVAMKCTEEQFNGIKDKLVEMGYRLSNSKHGEGWLCTNYNGVKDLFSMSSCTVNQPLSFKTFNPDLFLALAAMTDKEDGVKGEWWKYTDEMSDPIVAQKYLGEFIVPNKSWRKATAKEIIEHFEKKEFVLPEKWCVKVTEENRQDLKLHFCNAIVGCWVLYNGNYNQFTGLPSGCTEITFEQFEKYVDKKTLKHSLTNETQTSCPKATVVGSIECNINIEFDSKKAAEELFAKIVEFGKSSTPDYKFTTENWYTNDKKEVRLEYKTIIPIPPTKQATLFDDRVEITDWKPKEGEWVWKVAILPNGEFTVYKEKYKGYPWRTDNIKNVLTKHSESEAKQLVEKLKKAML